MSTEKKDININTRYPHDVHEAVKQLARSESRSFNNMVIWILREYIQTRKLQQQGRQGK
jgi:predicted HicB family RNase H-like nuclease